MHVVHQAVHLEILQWLTLALRVLNSMTRLTYNFSLQYPYIIQQTGSENAQTYQVKIGQFTVV